MNLHERLEADVLAELPPVAGEVHELALPDEVLDDPDRNTAGLEDGVGTDIGTALWTADYIRGRITFGADTTGSVYYLTGRTYDLNAAAAEIWRSKASYFATRAFDFSTDNHRVSGGQIHEHCLKMAAHYDGMALSTTTVLMRGDIDEYALD